MTISVTTITAPAAEPVSLAEALVHLRVDSAPSGPHPEEALIAGHIAAARGYVEAATGRALVTQTLEARWDAWEPVLQLPRSPAQSVTSVSYIDSTGATVALSADAYRADLASEAPRITPAYGTSWPSARCVTGAVAVRFVAGYGAAAAVPAPLRAAILLMITHLYETRGAATERALAEVPLGVTALLAPYRVWWL